MPKNERAPIGVELVDELRAFQRKYRRGLGWYVPGVVILVMVLVYSALKLRSLDHIVTQRTTALALLKQESADTQAKLDKLKAETERAQEEAQQLSVQRDALTKKIHDQQEQLEGLNQQVQQVKPSLITVVLALESQRERVQKTLLPELEGITEQKRVSLTVRVPDWAPDRPEVHYFRTEDFLQAQKVAILLQHHFAHVKLSLEQDTATHRPGSVSVHLSRLDFAHD